MQEARKRRRASIKQVYEVFGGFRHWCGASGEPKVSSVLVGGFHAPFPQAVHRADRGLWYKDWLNAFRRAQRENCVTLAGIGGSELPTLSNVSVNGLFLSH